MDQKNAVPVWFTTLIAGVLAVIVLSAGRDFLVPLAITALLFILTLAVVDRCARLRIFGRPLPTWLTHVLSVGLIVAAVVVLGSVVSISAEEVGAALPRYQERFALLGDKIEGVLGPRIVETVSREIAQIDVASWLAAAASELASALSSFGLVALYLVFLVSEQNAWTEKLPRLASNPKDARRMRIVLTRISDGVKQYMWVNAVTSAMSGAVAFAIFSYIDLDFAPLLALIVFAAGFIPNIGAFIGIALPSLVALVQFDDLTPFFIVLFGYGLADQIIANVVQPAMQGRSLNLSTFMVMVGLTFWATIWGGIGAFLAVPMMVVAMKILAEIPEARWIAVLFSADGVLEGDTPPDDLPEQAPPAVDGEDDFSKEVAQLRSDFDHRYD